MLQTCIYEVCLFTGSRQSSLMLLFVDKKNKRYSPGNFHIMSWLQIGKDEFLGAFAKFRKALLASSHLSISDSSAPTGRLLKKFDI